MTLSRVFRQAERSDIVLNAHKVNQGTLPLTMDTFQVCVCVRTHRDRHVLTRARTPQVRHTANGRLRSMPTRSSPAASPIVTPPSPDNVGRSDCVWVDVPTQLASSDPKAVMEVVLGRVQDLGFDPTT